VLLFYRDYRMGLVPKYILQAIDMLGEAIWRNEVVVLTIQIHHAGVAETTVGAGR